MKSENSTPIRVLLADDHAIVREGLRALIQTHARSEDLLRCALTNGMRTLRQDGLRWVLGGVTSLEEVIRVTRES